VLKIEIIYEAGLPATLWAHPGQLFLHLLFEAGVGRGRYFCAGAGLCGKCRVRFADHPPAPCAEDQARLAEHELAQGWRLACKHAVQQACRIEIPGHAAAVPQTPQGEGLAVDIGTTRIKWAVQTGAVASPELAMSNPQMGVGSEIMSRLRYALSSVEARDQLRTSVLEVLAGFVRQSGATQWAVAGNSTMIALLLGLPLDGLAHAPYNLPWGGGEVVRLDPELPPAYVPPLIAPFIGADVSAGLAFIVSGSTRYPFVLADLGTNGEFVLGLGPDNFYACSVPMGPAIEGVGLSCGSVAGADVLSRVSIGPQGLGWHETRLTGIAGSGYVSLLAALRRIGLVDEEGHFQVSRMPLVARIATRIQNHPMGRILVLEEGIYLAERDIEEFLKAKSGVNVALNALLKRAGLVVEDVAQVYLAGALGEHLEPGDLISLGFLPERWREKIRTAGNTSLAGTLLALRSAETRSWLATLSGRIAVDNLVEQKDFGTRFIQAMRFSWV
jgi:uncharacterized 2Fe-2S/4Fe-4S cluster protein (DUF4445 family)